MKKQILSLILALTLLLTLSGCGCKHEWLDATCTTPATCAKCGEAAGSPLGHTWTDATCTQPQTCSVCGATNGEPLGHQWLPATCTQPETCSVCGETQGDMPQGHSLDEKGTCTVCSEAVGTPLGLGNYTQYLTITKSSSEIGATKYGDNDYTPWSEFSISVAPDPGYTYHDVRISYQLTTSKTSRWENKSQQFDLTESGYLFEDPSKVRYISALATSGGDRWSYSSKSEALKIVHPNYSFNIVGVTGYIVPVGTDTQGN